MTNASDNPFSPPASDLRLDLGLSDGQELASRAERLSAATADWLAIGVGVVVGFLLGPDPQGPPTVANVAPGLLGAVLVLILNSVLLYREGTSLGKLLVGIRVQRIDGRPITVLDVLIRQWLLPVTNAVLRMSFGASGVLLADSVFIFGRRRQCIHDRLVGTVVVSDPEPDDVLDSILDDA